jgi:hypothetical protein
MSGDRPDATKHVGTYSVHAAPASGGDTVQGLYDA